MFQNQIQPLKPMKKKSKALKPEKKASIKKSRVAASRKIRLPIEPKVKSRVTMAASTGIYNQSDVIRIILDVAGKFNVKTNAKDIKKKTLFDNLDYTDELFDNLQIELDRYVKSVDQSVTVSDSDLGDCETVQDIIDVVENKLNV